MPVNSEGAVATNSWVEYDVSGATAPGVTSFGILSGSDDSVYFYSKENVSDNKPELIISTAP